MTMAHDANAPRRGPAYRLSDSGLAWPSHCCVPAFFERAILALGEPTAPRTRETRRALAMFCKVSMRPSAANPWDLPYSDNPQDWGSTPAQARQAFPTAQVALGVTRALELELRPLNEVPFGDYEAVVLENSGEDRVIALAFDVQCLSEIPAADRTPGPSRHVVRLTPLDAERDLEPHIGSAGFGFDYAGDIHVFDDSGEMPRGATVSWRALVRASRLMDGSFWVVRRSPELASPPQGGTRSLHV